MTIRHVVSWRFAGDTSEQRRANAEEAVRRLRALVGVVPTIAELSAGVNEYFPEANWDACLVVDFATMDDMKAYQVHPAHEEVLVFMRTVTAERSAVDFDL